MCMGVDYSLGTLIGDLANMAGVKYQCNRCHYTFDGEELVHRTEIKCPICGFRVLNKVRPPVARRVKAV
jgi:DNA-directed RNA polymerase subunit P